jgi:hypothetical protein
MQLPQIFGVEGLFENLMPRTLAWLGEISLSSVLSSKTRSYLVVIFRLDEVQSRIVNAFSA